jgi:two-component system, cell cycle response regulator
VTVRDSIFSVLPVAVGEVLVVADEPTRRVVLHHMSTLGFPTRQAESAERAVEAARSMAAVLDCVVLDLSLPGSEPWSFLSALRGDDDTSAVPVVVLSGRPPTEPEMLRIIEAGAADILTKPLSPSLLCAKVRAVTDRARAQRELRNKLRYALENAATDPLTGLYNRRYFERRLREESAHARRHKRPFAIVMIDLDHFKLVNDTYGHEDGDRVLRHVAEALGSQLREDDVACRYGGEELVLLLRGTNGPAARVVSNRLRASLAARPIALGTSSEPRHVTFSAGVAAADERNGYDPEDVVGRADAALYRAKRAGRNRVEME